MDDSRSGRHESSEPRAVETPHDRQDKLRREIARLPHAGEPRPASTAVGDLAKHRWFIFQTTFIAVVLSAVVSLLLPNQYTSTAVLLPSGKSPSLGSIGRSLSGQLADLGIGGLVPAVDPGESSELFPDVLKSRTVGEAVLGGRYTRTAQPGEPSFTLYDYFDSQYAFEMLYDRARIRQDPKTGIITIAVTTPYPDFSRQIADAFLAELEKFNRERRLTLGMERATFLDGRLIEVKAELEAAEDELKQFRSRNMNYAQSNDPEILAELTRLERASTIKSKVYELLTQQYELARLEAADQMPIVQVLDRPGVPARKSGPPRRAIVTVAMFLALFGAGAVAVALRPAQQAFPESRFLNRASRWVALGPWWSTSRSPRESEEHRTPGAT